MAVCILLTAVPAYVSLRLGVLATVATVVAAQSLIGLPMMASPGHWGADAMWMVLPLLALTAVFAFRTARGPATGLF